MQGRQLATLITSNKQRIVVGMGATGLSVARYLARRGEPCMVVDSRDDPPGLAELQQSLPDIPFAAGRLDPDLLQSGSEIIVSPGVPLSDPALAAAQQAGIPVTGDIELFARAAQAPVVGITGSNGKSTVTTLVGRMAARAGLKVAVGGNLGVPALDLLNDENELYVVELSSFQLEAVDRFNAAAAAVLNISPDHMDRYDSLVDYHRAKHRIFRGVKKVVVNRDDPLSRPLVSADIAQSSFGLGQPDLKDFGLITRAGEVWLAKGADRLMPAAELAIRGRHNIANALAGLALGEAAGLPLAAMLGELREFGGLPHRCQTVATIKGVTYVNDSKATNVGATIAAISGLAGPGKLVLVAGGQAKGQDFAELGKIVEQYAADVVLIGADAPQLAAAIDNSRRAATLEQAVALATELAVPEGIVLLSPACASFDMFSGFEERGQRFVEIVGALS